MDPQLAAYRAQRAALCDLLDELGPDAPTVCTGWSTGDLAAHLVVRERTLLAAAGIVVPPLAGMTTRAMQEMRQRHSYAELVNLVRSGPPMLSPYRLPGAEVATNAVEFFIHHEDVRRAGPEWEPQHLDPAFEDMLWGQLKRGARLMTRRAPVALLFRRDTGEEVAGGSGRAGGGGGGAGRGVVTVVGRPGELTLYASGRQRVARVEQLGDESAIAAATQASFGV